MNACAVAPGHGLFAAAGEEGLLECFDLRQRRSVGVLDAAAAAGAVRVSLPTLSLPEALACKLCGRAFASPADFPPPQSFTAAPAAQSRDVKLGPQQKRSALGAILWHSRLARSTYGEHAGVVCLQPGEGLTALRFSDSGLQCAVGTQNGLVALYDLRSSRPSIVKDHNYGAPIKDIKFHTTGSMAGAPMYA